jgi:hypothetical protein
MVRVIVQWRARSYGLAGFFGRQIRTQHVRQVLPKWLRAETASTVTPGESLATSNATGARLDSSRVRNPV